MSQGLHGPVPENYTTDGDALVRALYIVLNLELSSLNSYKITEIRELPND